MAKFCLIPSQVNNFKRALKDRVIKPEELAEMTSAQRRELFSGIVGEANAKEVNALFESKLLLKNRVAGYMSWVKKVAGITPEVRRDLYTKIDRLNTLLSESQEQEFLEDLVSSRLGLTVSEKETETIFDLSNKVKESKQKANEDGVFASKDLRYEYGWNQVNLENYVNDIKLKNRLSFREAKVRKTLGVIGEIPGAMKSMVSSLDNSFFGRQGVKTLLDVRTSKIWVRNFLKSWGDIGRELAGRSAIDVIKADIYSRPNAVLGKYKAGNFGLDVLSEEAFPSSLPEKIPVLKRLYKASESAYNGGALRLRADLADRMIKVAEKNGLDSLNKEQMKGLGELVGSMTGRSSLGRAEPIGKELNILFFSVKFLRSNFDTLTAGVTNSRIRNNPVARKEAAKNLVSIIISIAGILALARLIDPDSVEEDPRSTNFGKIKIFGQWTDITGGMGALVVLASRLAPSFHNGKFGFWQKTGSGQYKDLLGGGYGQASAWDIPINFFEGKLSPATRVLMDIWKGQGFGGDPVTVKGEIQNVTTPIFIQNIDELAKNPNSSNLMGSLILEGLGFSVSSYSAQTQDWMSKTSKEMIELRGKIGEDEFKKANDKYNEKYNQWYKSTTPTSTYKKLTDSEKVDLISKAKEEIKQQVFKEYRFKPTTEKKKKNRDIESLLP